MNLRVKSVVLLGVALSLTQAPIAESQGAQTDPWHVRSARKGDFETPRSLQGKVAIELPKEWIVVPGFGGIVFTAAEKPNRNNFSSAAIALEQMPLRTPFRPEDVNLTLAEIEGSLVRPYGGQNFEQQVKDVDGRRFILIQYTRAGVSGQTDRVIQYSIPHGSVMYRLICVAPEAQISKQYQTMFAHVAASFKAS